MRQVSRDPFARTTTTSARVYTGETCHWCGDLKQTKKGRKFLLSYTVESDGGRRDTARGLFCSVSCMRSYHG